ncbi:MAG TPA: tetratricopeptide repeat protein, partial [Polyangiaceae bacterium]|nr:tetratricopeptide repeat protein [Polyangiaceae bacterium]
MRSRALAVMASLFLASLPAAGQTPEDLRNARTWFTQGTTYERNGAWEKAIERFERALAVKQTPQLYLHMGYCRE